MTLVLTGGRAGGWLLRQGERLGLMEQAIVEREAMFEIQLWRSPPSPCGSESGSVGSIEDFGQPERFTLHSPSQKGPCESESVRSEFRILRDDDLTGRTRVVLPKFELPTPNISEY